MADQRDNSIDSAGPGPRGGMSVTLAVVVCALFVFVLARSVDPMTSDHPAFAAGDHTHYINMAKEPGGTHQATLCQGQAPGTGGYPGRPGCR